MEEKIAGVTLTHPDKIFYPETKTTKLDIAKYYESVEKLILPELLDRAVSLVRSPHGVTQKAFYQKHPSENFPEYIERVKIQEKEEVDIYITLDNLNDVIYLVNLGVLEFHTWNSKIGNLEQPDRIVFDLDPDINIKIEESIELAFKIKEKLEESKLKPTIKTSGKKGYHIIAELKEKLSWDEAKEFTLDIARYFEGKDPEKYTTEMKKVDRKGKIFIDYLRNTRGATNVAAYSTRIFHRPTISVPVEWEKLDKNIPPDKYDIYNFR